MTRRVRVVLIAIAAIVLAIPLLPGPGVFIIMAALADLHDAFERPTGSRAITAGFPPADRAGAGREASKPLTDRALAGGRRVA